MGAALLFSTGGAAIKVEAFSTSQVSFIRSGLAAIVLLAWARGRVEWSPRVVGIGVTYAAILTLFVAATRLTTAANAIFLQSAAPLYVLVLAPTVLGEHFERRDLPYIGCFIAGLALCLTADEPSSATATNPALGNLLAVACGVCWAATLVLLRWGQRLDGRIGVSAVVAGNLIASLGALPFAWPFPAAPASDWATVIYLGVVQIGVAYILLTAAMRELPALEVSLLLLLEPALNPVWAWLVRGERPAGLVIAGGVVIVATTAARSLARAAATRSL